MAVQNCTHMIGYRLVHIVAFHQDAIDCGDGAAFAYTTTSFEYLRKKVEYRWRVTARGWWLADRQADFPLRHRETGNRIDDQQDVLALISKIFGDGVSSVDGVSSHQGGLIRRGYQHHRALSPFDTQCLLKKIAYFSATFTDHSDNDDIRTYVTGHHSQQRAFPDATPGKNANALSLGKGQYTINRSDTCFKGFVQWHPAHWIDRWRLNVTLTFGLDIGAAIQRRTKSIEHAPDHARTYWHLECSTQ